MCERVRGREREGEKSVPTEVEDLAIRVSTIHHAREVKHFGSIVDLGPETVLQALLLRFESGGSFDEVEVGENSDEFGKSVGGEGREGFEGFLLKAPSRGQRTVGAE